MISVSWLVLITVAYLLILFYVAYQGDQKPVGQYSRYQTFLFPLSLMVYCSSWTIFGAAGKAAVSGWEFFTIYLGPMFIFLFCAPFLTKLVAVSKRQKTVSIADFIASRYGKSRLLAATVTIIALLGAVPYIALQLKAVTGAFDMLAGRDSSLESGIFLSDTGFYLSLTMVLFSILFGARRIDATEHHRGIINAICFESVVKIFALVVIGVLAYQMLTEDSLVASGVGNMKNLIFAPFKSEQISVTFFTQAILSAAAIFCLPRQFQVLAVESRGDEVSSARWGFPLLLLLVSLSVIPIAAAGLQFFKSMENSDLYVLSIPMFSESWMLATLAYLGGLSAATGMVIVSVVALSTMVSNDLILPILLRFRKQQVDSNYYPVLLFIRRVTIFILLALAYGYYRVAVGDKSLASIGLLAFAVAIQFAPPIIGGIYWRRGHKNGAVAGLLAGFFLWFYTLMMPTLVNSGWFPAVFVSPTPFGFEWLAPQKLLGFSFPDVLTHGVFWSLGANISCYFLFSLRATPSLTDRLQAAAFIDEQDDYSQYLSNTKHSFKVADLADLCGRFVGQERVELFLFEIEKEKEVSKLDYDQVADAELLQRAEKMLGGSVGSAMAENILNTALQASGDQTLSIVSLLNQTSKAVKFNRELMDDTLNTINQGISVVDQHLRLVAHNKAYTELFQYPDNFIKAGVHIEKIIRFNVNNGRGVMAGSSKEKEIKKRLGFLKSGEAYSYEREWKDGTVIQTDGNRLPNGGYVTTYTDITALKSIQNDLKKSNEELEDKVNRRTYKLALLNEHLREAMDSKSRFMTAASHDLSQPLSASKLYLGALLEDVKDDENETRLAYGALNALLSAESLLKSLFEISRLDSPSWEPEIESLPIQELLFSLENEFSVIAKEKGLRLKVVGCSAHVLSDKNLLHSILRNFLSNAIRYTNQGSVMLICRHAGNKLRIEVRDSGIGIAEENLGEIFQEYHQLHQTRNEGHGLGLAISKRVAERLNHHVGVRSRLGEGSVFYLGVQRAEMETDLASSGSVTSSQKDFLKGVATLCVDDEAVALDAISEIMHHWGATVTCARNYQEYLDIIASGAQFQLILADYHLSDGHVGLEVLKDYRNIEGREYLGILLTAERSSVLEDEVLLNEFGYLAKPIDLALLHQTLQEGLFPDTNVV